MVADCGNHTLHAIIGILVKHKMPPWRSKHGISSSASWGSMTCHLGQGRDVVIGTVSKYGLCGQAWLLIVGTKHCMPSWASLSSTKCHHGEAGHVIMGIVGKHDTPSWARTGCRYCQSEQTSALCASMVADCGYHGQGRNAFMGTVGNDVMSSWVSIACFHVIVGIGARMARSLSRVYRSTELEKQLAYYLKDY